MRVRFKTISAGPKGALFPGDLLDVSDSEAKVLVDGGYADYVTPPAPKHEPEKPVEATVEVRATTRRPRVRRDQDGVV